VKPREKFTVARQRAYREGFSKRAYYWRGFALAVLLVLITAYIQEWLFRGKDWLRPVGAFGAALLLILFSKWKRYLFIITFQTLGALAFMGALRAIFTGNGTSLLITVIGLVLSIGALIVMRSEPGEEKWLSRRDNGFDQRNFQRLDLELNSTSKDEKSPKPQD
jgi:hypothetical protein